MPASGSHRSGSLAGRPMLRANGLRSVGTNMTVNPATSSTLSASGPFDLKMRIGVALVQRLQGMVYSTYGDVHKVWFHLQPLQLAIVKSQNVSHSVHG